VEGRPPQVQHAPRVLRPDARLLERAAGPAADLRAPARGLQGAEWRAQGQYRGHHVQADSGVHE